MIKSSLRIAAELRNLAEIRRFIQETATGLGVDAVMIPDVVFQMKENAEETHSWGVAGALPLSEDVAKLARAGVFCLHYPDRPVTWALRRIAARIAA